LPILNFDSIASPSSSYRLWFKLHSKICKWFKLNVIVSLSLSLYLHFLLLFMPISRFMGLSMMIAIWASFLYFWQIGLFSLILLLNHNYYIMIVGCWIGFISCEQQKRQICEAIIWVLNWVCFLYYALLVYNYVAKIIIAYVWDFCLWTVVSELLILAILFVGCVWCGQLNLLTYRRSIQTSLQF